MERDTRKKHERVIVFKNMFDIEDFEVCVSSAIELPSNFKELCNWGISHLKKNWPPSQFCLLSFVLIILAFYFLSNVSLLKKKLVFNPQFESTFVYQKTIPAVRSALLPPRVLRGLFSFCQAQWTKRKRAYS